MFGPFLIDRHATDPWWEFETLMGLDRDAVAAIAEHWPEVDLDDEEVRAAIGNSMNNLLGYPHQCWADWPQHIAVSPPEVARCFHRWRAAIGLKVPGMPDDYLDDAL